MEKVEGGCAFCEAKTYVTMIATMRFLYPDRPAERIFNDPVMAKMREGMLKRVEKRQMGREHRLRSERENEIFWTIFWKKRDLGKEPGR